MASTASRSSLVEHGVAAVVVLAAVWSVWPHLTQPDFLYLQWADRDMVRSDVPFAQLPSMGAESSFGFGARIPGGAMHVLWWLGLRGFGDDPVGVYRFQWVLVALGASALAGGVARVAGALAGALVLAATLAATPTVSTLAALWNPGFSLGLSSLVIACVVALAVSREGRWLVPACLLLAWDLHTHLSAGILGAVLIGVCVASRPAGGLRWGALGLVLALSTWISYVLDDRQHGWANTHLLFDRTQLETLEPLRDDLFTRTQEAGLVVAHLSGASALSVDLSPAWGWGIALVSLGVVGLLVREQRAGSAAARTGLVGALVVTCMVAAYFRSSANAGDRAAVRYLAVGAAGFPLFVGAAWGALAPRLGARRPLGSVAAGALVLVLVVRQAEDVARDRANPEAHAWSTLVRWTDALRTHTGWTLGELTGRTVVVRPHHRGAGGWETQQSVSMAWALRRAGEAFPGSSEPPCAMLLDHGRGFDASTVRSAAFADVALPFDRVVSIDAVWPLDELHLLARYTPASGRCPSSFDARYVLTPEEELTRDPAGAPASGTAVRLADDGDLRRWRFAWPLGPVGASPLQGLLTARRVDAGWEVTLHANALRGRAWNYGFYANAAIVGPAVIARDAAGVELGRLQLARGVVGAAGALTPLRATGPLPDGAWSLDFVSDVTKVPWDEHPPGADPPIPLAIPLP